MELTDKAKESGAIVLTAMAIFVLIIVYTVGWANGCRSPIEILKALGDAKAAEVVLVSCGER